MKEKRYYLADTYNTENDELDIKNCTDEEFMNEAERQGTVYSEQGFVDAFNGNYVSTYTQYLRIIEVETEN